MKKRGILWGTKYVVIGPMQYSDGQPIRQKIFKKLSTIGMTGFDHYNKPFLFNSEEGDSTREELKHWMETEQYDKVTEKRDIRLADLALIDYSDFVICYFDKRIPTCGTWEEFFWANRLKRPIFFINVGGKKETPFWVLWTIPHKYIYNDEDEVLDVLFKINKGEISIDSKRWKLLKPEFRQIQS